MWEISWKLVRYNNLNGVKTLDRWRLDKIAWREGVTSSIKATCGIYTNFSTTLYGHAYGLLTAIHLSFHSLLTS